MVRFENGSSLVEKTTTSANPHLVKVFFDYQKKKSFGRVSTTDASPQATAPTFYGFDYQASKGLTLLIDTKYVRILGISV